MAAAIVEVEELQARGARRRRIFRARVHPLETCSEEELRRRYRFGRRGIQDVIELVRDEIKPKTKRNRAVPPCLQVLIALNFFATGSVQESTAAMHGVHVSTISRIIHRVARALCTHKAEVRVIL